MGRAHREHPGAAADGGRRRRDRARRPARSEPRRRSRDRPRRPRVFGDHRELLASGLCDAVVIATPNFTHVDIMRDALAADVHILSGEADRSRASRRRRAGRSRTTARAAARRLGGAGIRS
ncbi:MAG: Gfo/Idh/MocA family oxidoreductase [Betaproteobacteria bacterium]|nr:Gfo/Idh/MocA family oxidoreductase [Betaproteobacteria bacterium]